MTNEEKQLLLQDLCCRIPYRVKISVQSWDEEEQEYIDRVDVLYSVNGDEYIKSANEDYDFSIEDIKPYLLPMSSMSEEQREEYESLCIKETTECADLSGFFFTKDNYYDTVESFDWLNKNKFDYRGLIPKGIAIDATGKNIY